MSNGVQIHRSNIDHSSLDCEENGSAMLSISSLKRLFPSQRTRDMRYTAESILAFIKSIIMHNQYNEYLRSERVGQQHEEPVAVGAQTVHGHMVLAGQQPCIKILPTGSTDEEDYNALLFSRYGGSLLDVGLSH